VHRDKAYNVGKGLVEETQGILIRATFKISVQGFDRTARIIASERHQRDPQDVLGQVTWR